MKKKVVIIGAGKLGEVVLDILNEKNDSTMFEFEKYKVEAFVDNDPEKQSKLYEHYKKFRGIPVYSTDMIDKLEPDALIISIGDKQVRKKYYEKYSKFYDFINVIHPKAYVSPSAKLGKGNIIDAMSFIGTGATIGDNNIFSSNVTVEHHKKISSHNVV